MGVWDRMERIKSWRAGYMPRLSQRPQDAPMRKVIRDLMHAGELPTIVIGSEDVNPRDINTEGPPKRITGRKVTEIDY